MNPPQSIRIAAGLAFAALMITGEAGAASQAESLQQALEAQGWQAQTLADGSVIYTAPADADTAPTPAGDEPSGDQLEEALRERGWQVDRAPDGSLVMQLPPGRVQAQPSEPPAVEPPSTEASPPSEIETGDHEREGRAFSPAEAESVSGFRHWILESAPDGSVILRPRPTRVEAVAIAPCGGTAVPLGGLELPVDSDAEAGTIATLWLEQTGLEGMAVGRVRKVLRVYLVSIVTADPPFHLQHQLAVNAEDGTVVVLN